MGYIIIRVFIRWRKRAIERHVMTEVKVCDGGSQVKGCGQSIEDGKSKEKNFT